ncbi:MAG: XRE family transcriptional regulator [Scytonema sp. PMC 1069.18]|nr:XRE family transcriptional regulator [Scytonema sp. PMC 1069.18]MEC4883984.1 XRE family transcriptional regulator [Scytonema sp. PMC 1070.18]
MKTKPFSELRKKMTLEQQAESEMQANLALLYLTLSEVRESIGKTQSEVADNMGIGQPALSKIEHQNDIQVSTLLRYITSLGGSLTITANFPNREIVITQFGVTDSLQQ